MAPPLIDADPTLALFDPTWRVARRAYLALLRGQRAAAWLGDEPTRTPWWRGRDADGPLELPALRPGLDALGSARSK